MNKTGRTQILKTLLMMALAIVLCVGSMAPALAADVPITGGTESTPVDVKITKNLQMPAGTTTPAKSFTFSVTPVSVDGVAAASANPAMPTVGNQTIAFLTTENGTTTGGTKTVEKQTTAGIFSAINTAKSWPHAGVYEYLVKESMTAEADYTFSGAEYKVRVYVKNGTTNTYAETIAVEKTKDDQGGTTGIGKVDMTNGKGVAFLNGYKMENSGKDPIADNVLAIGKKVTGNYADKTKYFDFSVKVTKPATESGTPKYRVYVMDKTAAGSKGVTTTANTSLTITNDPTYGYYFELTSGTAATIKLKHDQWLSFVELPVGATYSVSETTVPANYTASNMVTEGTVVTPNTGKLWGNGLVLENASFVLAGIAWAESQSSLDFCANQRQ